MPDIVLNVTLYLFFPPVQPPVRRLKIDIIKFFCKIQSFNFKHNSQNRNGVGCLKATYNMLSPIPQGEPRILALFVEVLFFSISE